MPDRVLPITFPDDIARDLAIMRSANTRLIEADSGYEQALGLWSQKRVVMSLKLSVYSPERLAQILAFYEVVNGRQYGFRCRDHTDFFVGYNSQFIGASIAPHQFATGDGTTLAFQFMQTYTVGSVSRSRKITRPRNDVDLPVKVYKMVSGDWVLQTSGYAVDYDTGIVTFSVAPDDGQDIAFACLFDLPMRFDTDTPGLNMKVLQVGSTDVLKLVQIKE